MHFRQKLQDRESADGSACLRHKQAVPDDDMMSGGEAGEASEHGLLLAAASEDEGSHGAALTLSPALSFFLPCTFDSWTRRRSTTG